MTLSNNKTMLIYGLEGVKREALDILIKNNNLPGYTVIEKSMGKMTVRDVLNGLKLNTYDKLLPEEDIILFNNFTDEELDRAIKGIRSQGAFKPILAVVTPTSIDWQLEQLVEHLIEERAWHRAHSK